MKIVSSGRVLNSREFYEKKKKRRRIQRIVLFIVLLLALSSFAYFSRQERFRISEVRVLGEDIVDKEKIVQITKDLLVGRYLWTIPRSSSLAYPRSVIKRIILEKFPRFKSVVLDLNGFKSLNISVEERIPFALFCADVSLCYFLDEEGLIFALAPSFSDGIYIIYTSKNPIENPLGKRFITAEEFKVLSKFVKTLETLNIFPRKLQVADDEYDLVLPNDARIMWRRSANLNLIHSNLEAFLSNETIRAQNHFLDKILYLDLRTENKVFYKFK